MSGRSLTCYACSAARICSTGASEESVRLDVRTTLPVTRRVRSTASPPGVPVIRGPVSCDFGALHPPESTTGAIERPDWGHGLDGH